MNFFKNINIKVGQAFTIYTKTSREVLPIEEGLYELVYASSVCIGNDGNYVFIVKDSSTITAELWKKNISYSDTFTVKQFNKEEAEHLASLHEEGYIKIIEKNK